MNSDNPEPAETKNTPADFPSAAEVAFAALNQRKCNTLLRKVFEVLEYGSDGDPGNEWSSDTTQDLGQLFADYGITFTDPNDVIRCRFCDRAIAQRAATDDWIDTNGFTTCADGEEQRHEPGPRETEGAEPDALARRLSTRDEG